MKHYPWFRMYNEAAHDRKLEKLDDHEFRVWFRLMCMASEQMERGVIAASNREILALEVANEDTALLDATITKLTRYGVISRDGDTIQFCNWEKRQYDYPSDTPQAVTERVRRHRSTKSGNDMKRVETASNDAVTDETSRKEKKRKEEIRKDDGNALDLNACQEAANLRGIGVVNILKDYAPRFADKGQSILVACSQYGDKYKDNPRHGANSLAEFLKRELTPQAPHAPRTYAPKAEYEPPPIAMVTDERIPPWQRNKTTLATL